MLHDVYLSLSRVRGPHVVGRGPVKYRSHTHDEGLTKADLFGVRLVTRHLRVNEFFAEQLVLRKSSQ